MNSLSAKTQEVLKWFEQISAIPRKSGNEAKIRQWLLNWAKQNSFDGKADKAGNALIKIPGTPGLETAPTIVIQGHMDMVCEKTPDSPHDFTKDPIEFVYDGEWLKANKTTLGADNGIAIAIAIAMIMDKSVAHPPLELLFTVDEETGLSGANNLPSKQLEGKILLNLDSEDEGVFTIGCAGGCTTENTLPLEFKKPGTALKAYHVKIDGLKGGHSGVDIKLQRGNAIKLLARALFAVISEHHFELAGIKAGTVHNAIPRSGEAIILFEKSKEKAIETILQDIEGTFKKELENVDDDFSITLETSTIKGSEGLTKGSLKKVLNVLMALPHGVATMATAIPGLVETSNNLATVHIENNKLKLTTSQRSSITSRMQALTQRIHSTMELAEGAAKDCSSYPPWEPNWSSDLLEKCKAIYKNNFGKDPIVEVIHAGLECGVIGSKYPGMDMISYGPTIKFPHSPDEKLKISDIDKIWDFTAALFESYK